MDEDEMDGGIEWGVYHVRTRSVWRTGMTLLEAADWIATFQKDGGKVGAFQMMRRELGPWTVIADD